MAERVAGLMRSFDRHQHARGFSPSTRKRRRWTLGQLAAYLDPGGFDTLDAVGLEEFLLRWDSPATRHSLLCDVHVFYRWAVRVELLPVDPSVGVDRPKVPRRSPTPIRPEDVRRLIAVAEGDVRTMILLAAYAGLRVSEIAALCGRDVHLKDGLFVVRRGKGGKDRTEPIAAELSGVLSGCPAGHLFPGLNGEGVSRRIRAVLQECGIDARPHDLRHSFGTQVARRVNGNVVLLARLMGHESVATAQAYNAWVPPMGGETTGLYDSMD